MRSSDSTISSCSEEYTTNAGRREGPEASVPVSQKNRRFGTKMDVEAWSSHTPWADLNVRGGVSFYRLSTHISQGLIKLPPPPHFRGLLQKYSTYMPLLVWNGSLFKQN